MEALQNGSLTSHEVSELTGMPQATVLSTARKLRTQGKITTNIVKVGKHNLALYTLVEKPSKTVFCGIQTQGIFSKAEYAAMNAQARKHMKNVNLLKGITNHQSI